MTPPVTDGGTALDPEAANASATDATDADEVVDTDDEADGDEGGAGDPRSDLGDAEAEQPWSWHAIRVSGLFLVVLLPIHFAVTIIGGDVGDTTAATMYNRLRNTWWRGFEWIVLGLAIIHTVLAVRAAIARSDLAHGSRHRLELATSTVGALLAATTAWFLLTYH